MSSSEQWIVIPRWDELQHHDATKRGRDPIWIKLYTRLHSDDAWLTLSGHQRAILFGLWIEYARSGSHVAANTASLTRRLGLRVSSAHLQVLVDAGWIQLSSAIAGNPSRQCHDTVPTLSSLEEKRRERPTTRPTTNARVDVENEAPDKPHHNGTHNPLTEQAQATLKRLAGAQAAAVDDDIPF